jgi:hypothetical protein
MVLIAYPMMLWSRMNDTNTDTFEGLLRGCTNTCLESGCSQYSSSTSSGRSASMLPQVDDSEGSTLATRTYSSLCIAAGRPKPIEIHRSMVTRNLTS